MAAPSNRFDRVEWPDPTAVTVTIRGEGGRPTGEVEGPVPAGADGTSRIRFGQDGSLSALQALSVGCHLANELALAVVVIDGGRHWQPGWGRLEQR